MSRDGLCAFCSRAATMSDEHVWDAWLNPAYRSRLRQRGFHFVDRDGDGNVVREYDTARIDRKAAVVCRDCNTDGMSAITDEFRKVAQGIVIDNRAVSFLKYGILTVAAFGFMKAVVVDHMHAAASPFFTPEQRKGFYENLIIPAGTQMWLAGFISPRRGSGSVRSGYLTTNDRPLRDVELFACTYAVGFLVIQVVGKRWSSTARRRRELPDLVQHPEWDSAAVQLWPPAATVAWPPEKYLDASGFQLFADRWTRVLVARRRAQSARSRARSVDS